MDEKSLKHNIKFRGSDLSRLYIFTLAVKNRYRYVADVENTFRITPETVEVPASQTALFEVVFDPNGRSSNLFTSELVGYVRPMQREDSCYKEIIAFPAMTSIRLIGMHIFLFSLLRNVAIIFAIILTARSIISSGHSFPVCSDGWIPQYEIPYIIKMPPCVPSFPVYTTFAIKRFGHLPLMYRFVPPESSRFVVKPMMGIIYQYNGQYVLYV